MKEKQAVTEQVRDRYRKASKKEKTLILNEFVQTTGYNRKYALRNLSAADVSSGWIELFALPNKAHKWALEALQTLHNSLSFPLIELHSDNGSEFINRGTINWRDAVKTLLFTRSGPHHKNDNCLRHKCRVEQKTNLWFDGAVVRNYAGCARFDTPKEYAALVDVYSPLCLLLNYFIPGKKLISKTSMGSKTIKRYDQPKTPFQYETPKLFGYFLK